MKKFILFLGAAIATMVSVSEASAQIKVGEGQVSVALESNSSVYMADELLKDIDMYRDRDRTRGNFGSNDFLKVDYTLDKFSAGVQIDAYLPALYGYDLYIYQQRDSKRTGFLTKYIQWEDENWGIRIGDIYDQFGNGFVFRAYEDRNLAFNNSLAGARLHYNLNNLLNIKVLAGAPRLYDIRTKNAVWGGDLSLSLSDIIGWNNGFASIEGSYVGRYLDDASYFEFRNFDNSILNMVSGRANFEYSGFTFRGEYAAKLNDDIFATNDDPSKGNAIYLDLGYNYKRFSVSANFRRMRGMTSRATVIRDNENAFASGGNLINYIPTLVRQHTYSLAGLNPFMGATTGDEIGGQIDVYYSLRNPKARGKYWNFHANFSMFNTLDHLKGGGRFTGDDLELMREGRNIWMDFNFDVERQWNKTLKTTFFYSYQRRDVDQYDNIKGHYADAHIFVGDVTYKFNKKHSMRFEAQYLAADNYQGDWVAASIEYNFAPKFSFYVSDMWNCEEMNDPENAMYDNFYPHISTEEESHELLHYYQVGMSYTHNSLRAQLSYGRNREGIVCSGGVCRKQPAYTGVNLAITLSF
ncbi:MAG: hypothetical protein IIU78_01850 [Alistipes sp.]|nr:hypothetical protein [Alistipes sp.]